VLSKVMKNVDASDNHNGGEVERVEARGGGVSPPVSPFVDNVTSKLPHTVNCSGCLLNFGRSKIHVVYRMHKLHTPIKCILSNTSQGSVPLSETQPSFRPPAKVS
jgi:hypothetical protein